MVIQSSNVFMGARSSRRASYTHTRETTEKNLMTGQTNVSCDSFQMSYEQMMQQRQSGNSKAADVLGEDVSGAGVLGRNPWFGGITRSVSGAWDDDQNGVRGFLRKLHEYMEDMHNRLLDSLFTRRRSGRLSLGGSSLGGSSLNLSSGYDVNVWDRVTTDTYTYEESEEMSFSTTGKVVCADGRELEFNMELSMSRQFVEQLEDVNRGIVMSITTDPLVISLDSNPVSVSDQKWKFDIDGDGETDSISMLSEGAGFLAYDKNGDGVINDGTELFGSRTGNGFAELSAYDEDNNGWIDENDSIYEKLSVWVKNDKGEDKMLSLKDAKVGAIYLGSAATEFALKSLTDNSHNAQIRRTGMYLNEDGQANTIQQLDMVKALIS